MIQVLLGVLICLFLFIHILILHLCLVLSPPDVSVICLSVFTLSSSPCVCDPAQWPQPPHPLYLP